MNNTHCVFRAIFLSLWLLCGAGLALAQGTNLGTIRGTVTDPNGSVILNARVQVTDLGTNLSRDFTTDKEGNFEAAGLKSGSYRVNVTAQGFKTAVINEVALRGSETVRVDAQLQAGGATETIEVAATGGAINLETPTVSGTLTNREILGLPRDSRDIYSFLYLNPNITQGFGDGSFKFIGAQSYGASFSLDGQRVNGGIFGEPTASQPSFETIGELVVLSNNFTAEYAGVANVRVETRRGGKDYQGSVFYNNKNSALAAWSIGDKRGQSQFTPTPALSEFPTPYFNLNETGGSFSGPVPFSKKTFFMAAYERRWSASPVRFRSLTLPHASLYAGDFSKVSDGAKPVIPAEVTLTPEEIAANTALVTVDNVTTRRFVTIPSRLLNPTTAAFIKSYFPATSVNAPINASNGRLVDYFENLPGLTTRDLGTLRIDHELTEKDKIAAVYNIQPRNQASAAVAAPYTGLGLTQNEQTNHTLSLSHTHIFADNLINEARGGFNYQFLFRTSNTTPTSFLKSIGFEDSDIEAYYGVIGETARPTFGHVGVSFGNSYATFGTGGRNTFRPLDQKLYTFGDTLTWIKGRHSIKGGFDVVYNAAIDGFANNRGNPRGLLTYSTGGVTDRFARFLIGLPATTAAFNSQLRPPMDVFNWEQGYFIQDDFKVHPRLTLYLGLRYELITPFIERNDLLVNFDPDFKAANGRRGRFVVPTQKTLDSIDPRMIAYGVVTADEVGVGRGLIKTDTNNLAPRLGAAWRVTDKSVIRGGYGVFYPTSAAQGMRDPLATNAFNQGRTKTSPAATPLSGWPGGINPHGVSPFSAGALRVLGSQPSANAVPFDIRQPRIQQYNATFEQELPWKLALRASYLGTRLTGLISGIDLNMLPPSDTPYGTTTGDGVTPCTPGEDCDLSPADIARLPFQELGTFLSTYGNTGRGRSHAMQIEVNRRMSSGFTFNFSYTLLDQKSSAPDTGNASLGGTVYNQFKPENDFGAEAFVSRHRFVAYGIIEAPFGKGRKFGGNAPAVVDAIAGGWQVSWNMFAKSGFGFTPYWDCGNCDPVFPGNIASDSVDAVGGFGGTSFRPIVTGNPQTRTGDRFFNPDAFDPPPLGADFFDNPNVAKRNLLKGPGAWGANLGLDKSFRFGERFRLRLGAQFNNVFNHPLRPPSDDQSFGLLGTINLAVNPANRQLQIASIDRNPDFGRFFDSFNQEGIENRRTIRITLRLTF
ncbi:MAG TPA: carboxypeptidase-like regulatory domain-containing protein [Blastocatellia bacterium]|nr:carboxypeptidase-like regulatory domain-containing protein [Blastocatellia bacterium]